ncbi:rhodanese-like domain-containing protein [Thalassobacillus sp. C254]|uniref:rhodanese-like domain-containing protein n=1 Tax=Thalassobacillus sp. C254 TaxID=1225341 RepID=UPI0006D245D5|nr:rhodanese-like domain-containing protein [Thalassobacillus sp. C254]
MSKEMDGIKQLSYEELKEIYEKSDQDKIIVDVREIDEYIAGHIPRIPLIPMSEIAEKAGDFDKSKEHIFICRSGRRSSRWLSSFNHKESLAIISLEACLLGKDHRKQGKKTSLQK